MRRALLGSLGYLELSACLALFFPPMVAAHLRHRHDAVPRIPGRWMRRLGRTSSSISPVWHFRVAGEAPADILERPYVVVANHASNADPFLLSHLPWDMRWIAKEELFHAPVIGWFMRLSGDIPLRRGNGDSVRQTLAEAKRTLERGLPVMMFPEGTRSKDGRLQRFKEGAFALAIEAQVPVLPIAIEGTRDCIRKNSIWPGEARATATILEPIPTAGLEAKDVEALCAKARARIAAALGEPAVAASRQAHETVERSRASSPPARVPERRARAASATPGPGDAGRRTRRKRGLFARLSAG